MPAGFGEQANPGAVGAGRRRTGRHCPAGVGGAPLLGAPVTGKNSEPSRKFGSSLPVSRARKRHKNVRAPLALLSVLSTLDRHGSKLGVDFIEATIGNGWITPAGSPSMGNKCSSIRPKNAPPPSAARWETQERSTKTASRIVSHASTGLGYSSRRSCPDVSAVPSPTVTPAGESSPAMVPADKKVGTGKSRPARPCRVRASRCRRRPG